MTQKEMRSKIANLKHGDQTSVNGYDIKKLGTQWVIKKGDHIKKSFDLQSMDVALSKILSDEVLIPTTRKQKRAVKAQAKKDLVARKKQEKLNQKQQKLSGKKAVKAAVKPAVKKAVVISQPAIKKAAEVIQAVAQERPFKRNKVLAESLNLIVQAFAYFTWFVYFFTEEIQKLLGDNSLYAVIGVGVLALFTHLIYARQLGKRHRIVNILVGLLYVVLAVGALVFYYGPITHRAIDLNDVLPSLELAIQEPQAVAIVGFMFIKWVLLFFVNKK